MSTATVDTGEIASHIARLTALAGECGEVAAMIGAAEVPWNPVISPMVPAQAEATGCAVNAAALALALSRTYTETAGILVIALPRYEELERGVAALFVGAESLRSPWESLGDVIGWAAGTPLGQELLLDVATIVQTPEGVFTITVLVGTVNALGAAAVTALDSLKGPLADVPGLRSPTPAEVLGVVAILLLGAPGERKLNLVRVTKTSATERMLSMHGAPGSMSYFATAIPAGDKKGQVRIDRFVTPDGRYKYTVAIDGTRDWGTNGKEPFNLASNLNSYSGHDSESVRAVKEAMKKAGITGADEVEISGHSQGGMIASDIARSREFNVKHVTTFGSPVDQSVLPRGVDGLAIAHQNDAVPALGGTHLNTAPQGKQQHVVVAGPTTVPTAANPLPAHHIDGYRNTAAAMDAGAASPASQKAMQERADFYRGCQLDSSTTYEFESEAVGDD